MANPLPPFPLPLPPPGQGFQGPPMPQHHRDFASFYGDNSLDHCHSDYTRILECFDPEVTTVLMHVLMHEQAVSSGPIPQAYLYCASQRQQVQIFCVHLPTKFPSVLVLLMDRLHPGMAYRLPILVKLSKGWSPQLSFLRPVFFM